MAQTLALLLYSQRTLTMYDPVKQAQVYLMILVGGCVTEGATCGVQQFFIIMAPGRIPNRRLAFPSAADIVGTGSQNRLRNLNMRRLAPTLSHVVHKRLQTLQYQIPPTDETDMSEALVQVMPRTRREGQEGSFCGTGKPVGACSTTRGTYWHPAKCSAVTRNLLCG
jgi:hypothetical protein